MRSANLARNNRRHFGRSAISVVFRPRRTETVYNAWYFITGKSVALKPWRISTPMGVDKVIEIVTYKYRYILRRKLAYTYLTSGVASFRAYTRGTWWKILFNYEGTTIRNIQNILPLSHGLFTKDTLRFNFIENAFFMKKYINSSKN